ncbi:MAG TPA: SpoIID/LytB domain-containing protein [Acidimicrobiales bacterium]|nr:SpoIID/LytB domain-containing protein [Acidimicrobiales bacterium]
MRSRPLFSRGLAAAAAALAVSASAAATLMSGTASAAKSPAAGYPASDVTFFGHGLGPGVGMGQWGAFGYAEQYHETYQWILAHFYSGTVPATTTDPVFTVAIDENQGDTPWVTSQSAFTVNGYKFPANSTTRLVLTNAASGSFAIEQATAGGCHASSWKILGSATSPTVTPYSQSPTAPNSQILTLCRGDGVDMNLRGLIRAIDHAGGPRTLNLVPLDEYLADVVPDESGSIWGTIGSPGPQSRPWGFQSLESQAVAARTYAFAYKANGGWFGYADICDDTYCQSYQGTVHENSVSTAAVTDTVGQILDVTGTKNPAVTQYSASTGGYTIDSSGFSAVPDLGDAICVNTPYFTCNPNHDWTASVPVTAIETAFPSIGTLTSVSVLGRNGLGDLGGRVTNLLLQGTKSSLQVDGGTFAADFGLMSDWFSVTNGPGGRQSGLGGYYLVGSTGSVTGFGSVAGSHSYKTTAPLVSVTAAPHGYWIAGSDGAVYGAPGYGSMAGRHLNKPIVGIASTPDGKGYWLVATDGGIFTFGDAKFHGSTGNIRLNKPIVGMATTLDGKGYWLVASDGGIFTFGDAKFHGSTGNIHLNKPIVGMAPAKDGAGYWLVASDGGMFTFGTATFYGSLGGQVLAAPASGMISTPDGYGYEIVTGDGGVHPFGDAPQFGDLTSSGGHASGIVGISAG